MANSEPVLTQIIAAGIVVGLPWFLIVTGVQRLRKKRFYGWGYFILGGVSSIFLSGWVYSYVLAAPEGYLFAVPGITILPFSIAIALTELFYAKTEQHTDTQSVEIESGQIESGSAHVKRYFVRMTVPKPGLYSCCLWVRVDDANGNLLFHSKKITVKPGAFLSPFEDGVGFYGQDGKEQEKRRIKTLGVDTVPDNHDEEVFGINHPSKDTSPYALCDVIDRRQDKRLGSLKNGIAISELIDTAISGDLMLGDTWHISDTEGNNIAKLEPGEKLLGPLYDYSIYEHGVCVGRVYLRGRNPLGNRPLVIELSSSSASQSDPRMVFCFATLVFAFDVMKLRNSFGAGG